MQPPNEPDPIEGEQNIVQELDESAGQRLARVLYEMLQERNFISRIEIEERLNDGDYEYSKGTFNGNTNLTSRGATETQHIGENAEGVGGQIRKTSYIMYEQDRRSRMGFCLEDFDKSASTNEDYKNRTYLFSDANWQGNRNLEEENTIIVDPENQDAEEGIEIGEMNDFISVLIDAWRDGNCITREDIEGRLNQINVNHLPERLFAERYVEENFSVVDNRLNDLRIFIIRTNRRKYYAGFVKAEQRPQDWPNHPSVQAIFDGPVFVGEVNPPSLVFTNNREIPFELHENGVDEDEVIEDELNERAEDNDADACLEFVEFIFSKALTKGDYLQAIYALRQPDGGGGQQYFDIPRAVVLDLMLFLSYATVTACDQYGRLTFKIDAFGVGWLDKTQVIEFAPRTGGRYKISRVRPPHFAWTPEYDFPGLPLEYQVLNQYETGSNIVYYGVPGSGKSYQIRQESWMRNAHVETIVFHPEYTYSDFIGQIIPKTNGNQIMYDFSPGPFTKMLKLSHDNPSGKFVLIIEEINRGNAPAIFGDIFQLLDRRVITTNMGQTGESEYGVHNENVAFEVHGSTEVEVKIPRNLWIVATMNTSDQNVFTLDTAFQRRWRMKLVNNAFEDTHPFKDDKILDTDISWQTFCTTINNVISTNISSLSSMEDKRLGVYFIQRSDLNTDGNESPFADKVLKYLWDDVCRFDKKLIFVEAFDTLEAVIKHFNTNEGPARFGVFNERIRTTFYPPLPDPQPAP